MEGGKAEQHFTLGAPKDLVVVKGASVYDGFKKLKTARYSEIFVLAEPRRMN